MYKVFSTQTYDREIKKLPKEYQRMIVTAEKEIADNPHTGKPLTFEFLREKKIKEKRIYYLVYDDIVLVLLVATSGKKNQQDTINHIKDNLKQFKKYAEELSRQSF